MSYKDWEKAFESDEHNEYYNSELSRMMSNAYLLKNHVKVIKEQGNLTESMKKDVINIMIVNFLNVFRMCSEEQYRKFLPSFYKDIKLNEHNRNGLLDFHESKCKNGMINVLDTSYQKPYLKRTNISYKQLQDSYRNFNEFASLVSDAEYLKTIDFEDLFPSKDLKMNPVSFKANIEDYYKSIGTLFKKDKKRFESYKESAESDLEQILILMTLNKKNLEISSTNAKYFLKTLLDGDYIDILLLNIKDISLLITDKDIVGFQSKILAKYPTWKEEGFQLSEIKNLLERIGVDPENFSKVDKNIKIQEMDSMVLMIDAYDLVQNFFNIRKQKVNVIEVQDILDRFLKEKQSLKYNPDIGDNIFENNVFNLVTNVGRINFNLENDFKVVLTILYPENYPLSKIEVKDFIKNELNLFFQNKPGLSKIQAEDITESMIEKKIMKQDIEENPKAKNKKIIKF